MCLLTLVYQTQSNNRQRIKLIKDKLNKSTIKVFDIPCYVALIIMIKSMKVKVTYTVEMGDYTASDKVKNRLIEACEKQELLDPNKIQDDETGDWIFDNINERDSLDWEFEVEDIA